MALDLDNVTNIPKSSEDRFQDNFVQHPDVIPEKATQLVYDPALERVIEAISGDIAGSQIIEFSEVNAVASDTATTILSYTVPVAKELRITSVKAGGDNIAEYRLKIDDNTKDIDRTYFGAKLSTNFLFNATLYSGQNIKIEVEHYRPTVGKFESTIIGVLLDA